MTDTIPSVKHQQTERAQALANPRSAYNYAYHVDYYYARHVDQEE